MYFVPPSREHATSVSEGLSDPVPSRLAALVQSIVANFALTSGLTPVAGVAAVEVSLGFTTPGPLAST